MEKSAILAAAVIPWSGQYEFEENTFVRQVAEIAAGLSRHIYIFGTAGEGYGVSERQFREIASVFWRCAGDNDVTPMLGIISPSLGTVIERIEFGRDVGFREFQLSLPSWGGLNDAELETFFEETCGR